ncbi:MAG: hypothetical protein MK008_03775 [Bdellovibrionales bacterium]|nr:hypothetical protein [Bdellovibrionales bacterium]
MKKMIAVLIVMMATPVFAQKMSMGFLTGVTTASQDDVNTLIKRADIRGGGITTRSLNRRPTFEFTGYWQYELENSNLAFQIRPSYLFVDEDGSRINTAERYEYFVSGYTLFPIAKMYLYEKDRTRLFAQAGIGWGFVNLKIDEGAAGLEASAMQMGSQIGAGAEFCIFGENHCLTVEGSYRYLEFKRMEIDSVRSPISFNSESGGGTARGISNPTFDVGGEVEIDDRDLRTTFSGFIGLIGYTYYFE